MVKAIELRRTRRQERAERLAFILDGRRRGLSYATIGAACNPPISQQRVHQLYTRALAEIPAANLAELRQEHRERLENIIARFEAIAGAFVPLVQGGQVVVDPRDGQPMRDIRPAMEALKEIRATSESLRKLDGVDAPARQQIEAVAVVRHEVVGVDLDQL